MRKPRRNHSPAFKWRIAMEALKGIKSVTAIAEENPLHPAQVTAWKSELVKNAESLFVRKNAVDEERVDMERATERLQRNATLASWSSKKSSLKKSASSWGRSMRKLMVEPEHPQRSIRKQARLLHINRNRLKPRVAKS
ncbi:MAG: transposase-like protein, partial [Candidatus Omnitrophota bacterium]